MPITYHPHQGRTVQKAVESEVPVQQSVAASSDVAISVSVSPVSEVGLSTQANLIVANELSLSSAISVGQVVGASADTSIQVSASPTSAVGVSSTQEFVVFTTVEVSSSISVGQAVGASTDTAIQVSAAPASQVGVSTSETHAVGVAKSVSTAISVGQDVQATTDTAVQVSASPTSAVGVSSTEEHAVGVAKSVSTTVQVGQDVQATTDTAIQVSASPTSAVDLSSTATKEIEYPVYERTASSTINVGQAISTSVDTAVQVSASPSSAVGVFSSESSTVDLNVNPSAPFQNDLPDYDALWTDGATDYSDLSDVLEGSVEARVDLSGTATGVIAESGGAGDDGTALVVHENDGTRTLMAMVGDGEDLIDGDHAVVEYDISGLSGYHKVGWSADASEQTLVLYVDGAVVGKDTYVKEGTSQGRLAGGGTGTVGTKSGGARQLGLGWSFSDYDYGNNIQWCTVYTGVSTDDVVAPVYERTASTTISVGQSVSASTDTSTQSSVSPTSSVGVSSSATTEVDEPATVSPSTVFTNLGSYTANWDDPSVDYDELDASVGASGEVQVYYDSGFSGVLMEDGGGQRGLGLVITDTDELLFMAGDGSATSPSSGAARVKQDLSNFSAGTYKFGWSASDTNEKVALYIDGNLAATATFTPTVSDLTGGNPGGIKGRHGGGIRDFGQGWSTSTDYNYGASIDWCVVYPGDITPDVQQSNSAPTADLVVTDDPSGDLVVEADAQGSSDPDGDSLTYDYDWGDGTTDTGAGSIATHTYSSEGTYTVTVTVDDGSLTDQASQNVTVSTSSGSEVVHDFEGGAEGWVSVESGVGRTTTYARGGSYSYGGGVSNAQAGELAYVEPSEISGGNKIESLTYHWLEEVNSFGGGLRLYDSSGSLVLGALTDNPQWKIVNGSGSITQIYDGGGAYKDWIKVEITFDWSAGTADITYTNEATGTSRTELGVSIGGNGVEKIQLTNYQGGSFGSGDFYYWIDDLKFVPATSTSGPSFSDGVAESFTKNGSNTASHDASWDGSAAPYSFKVYKDSSKQTIIYSNSLIYNTSDNQDNYTTSTSISDLTFGSTVYFEVTDNNGNSSTTSVSVGVSS